MPTVHLSLPNSVYAELKERAGELGVQVTDLIKFYIRMGLSGGLPGVNGGRQEGEVDELAKKVEALEKENKWLKMQVISMRGKVRELEEYLVYLIQRIETLEEQLVGQQGIDLEIREG